MTYYLLSIAVVTLLAWSLYKAKVIAVCPTCAGVAITWSGSLAALYFGASWADPGIIALLMGASLGALAEKYGRKFGLFWKSGVVLLGLPAVYLLVRKSFWPGLGLMVVVVIWTLWKGNNSSATSKEKDLFQDCC